MEDTHNIPKDTVIAECLEGFQIALSEIHRREHKYKMLRQRYKAMLKKCEQSDDAEHVDELIAIVETALEEARRIQKHIAEEIGKMRAVETTLNNAPKSELADAFATYIRDDYRMSKRSITMFLYEYDEIFARIREFETEYFDE